MVPGKPSYPIFQNLIDNYLLKLSLALIGCVSSVWANGNSIQNGLANRYPLNPSLPVSPFGPGVNPGHYYMQAVGRPIVIHIMPQKTTPIVLDNQLNYMPYPMTTSQRYPSTGHYASDYMSPDRWQRRWPPMYSNFVFDPITGTLKFRKPYNGGFIDNVRVITTTTSTTTTEKPNTEEPVKADDEKNMVDSNEDKDETTNEVADDGLRLNGPRDDNTDDTNEDPNESVTEAPEEDTNTDEESKSEDNGDVDGENDSNQPDDDKNSDENDEKDKNDDGVTKETNDDDDNEQDSSQTEDNKKSDDNDETDESNDDGETKETNDDDGDDEGTINTEEDNEDE